MPTLVNVKNKAAVLLQRTPMLVTTNTYPWKFFNDEEEAIKNRMFFHEVRKYHWSSPKPPTPKFFCSLFKSIRRFVDGDEFFPYDLSDDDHYSALYEAVMSQIKSLAIPKIEPGTSLIHESKCDFSADKIIYIPWAAPKIPELFWQKVRKGDEYSMALVKNILMCFSDDDVNLYCHWNDQDKLVNVDLQHIHGATNASIIWSFLERCLDELNAFKGPVCDGMSQFQRNMRKYYKMLELLMHRSVFLMSNVVTRPPSPERINPPPAKRVKFGLDVEPSHTAKPIQREMSKEELKNTSDMISAGVPSNEIKKYIDTCKKRKTEASATVTSENNDESSQSLLLENPSSTTEVVEDGSCLGCKYDKPGQRSHMGPGGCLENPTVMDNETCEGCRLNLPGQRAHMGNGGCNKETCEGCRLNLPGQKAHMGIGGCLAEHEEF